ncbi:TetR/AcrR family transcriptional regulator [Nocardia gipuzkoensis]|uniref:TetR/AcrR family transcriptional regulator n=1 Tax=Nocardia gipuzkoensis TaxID=2749991 RepID=UPI0015EF483C|nr:TetR/AcrR family transcriptional regulator [Nocardia gipuzkoensis]
MVESESLRDRLVDAGVDLLEEVGAAQLGLRAITRAAGVSHGAPRRHFPTHRALLAAVAARGFADLTDRFAEVDAGSARERLARMSAEYIEFAGHRPEMFSLMFRHDLLEGSGENLRSVTLPLFARFADLVGAAATSGAIDPRARALALWTNLHGIATVRANRSLRLVEPGVDVAALVARALEVHLA